MKRFVVVLFMSAAIAIVGCTSSSTTGGNAPGSSPVATTPSGGHDNGTHKGGSGSVISSGIPKIEIPDGPAIPKGR